MLSRILTAQRRRSADRQSDAGFVLLESIVAMTVITVVMTALTALLVNVTQGSSNQRAAQAAAQLAVSALDRAQMVGAKDAVAYRDPSTVDAQLTTTPASPDFPATAPSVAPWLSSMTKAEPSGTVGRGLTAPLPTVATHQKVNGITFSTSYFVGYCWRPAATSGDCVGNQTLAQNAQPAQASRDFIQASPVQYVRVVVVVAWPGTQCPTTGCTYVSATLLNGPGDPLFNFDQTVPTAPVLASLGNQVSVVGQPVTGLQLSATGGALPLQFSASGLPDGLTLDPATGLISGTPTAAGTYTVTVTVTDAFLLTGTAPAFTWTVRGALALAGQVPNQSTVVSGSANLDLSTFLTPSGGIAPYSTWTATGLPTGLKIVSGSRVVTGSVAASVPAGTSFSVVVTVADSAGNTVSAPAFRWAITAAPPPTITSPVSLTTVVNTPVNATASFTCPAKGCVLAGAGALPSWLAVSALSPTATSGTLTLSGKPPTSGTGSATLTVRDANGASAQAIVTWNVAATPPAAPTVTYPNITTARSSNTTAPQSKTCAGGGCTYQVTSAKECTSYFFGACWFGWTDASAVVSVDGNGKVTVQTPDLAIYSITIKVTDQYGSNNSDPFTWTFSS